jgi:hypothetical protein
MWLHGFLLVPFWIAMMALLLGEPERLADDPAATVLVVALPIGLVIGGLIGLVGLVRLVRVLTLSHCGRPKFHRLLTIGMVGVGMTALLAFHFVGGLSDLAEVFSVRGLVYLVLPFAGTAWLLAKSWRFLLAGSVRPDVESRSSRVRRERRDDWRLDA